MNFYDFDAEKNYASGAFNKKYKTCLDGKVRQIRVIDLPYKIRDSFLNGEYNSVITTEEFDLYRVFGRYKSEYNRDLLGNSKIVGAAHSGAFATTEFAESYIDVKIRLALEPSWLNTHMYEARIHIPIGTILNIGKVAPITTKGGTVLDGGADQILLPANWSEGWIVGFRVITASQLKMPPEYYLKEIPPFETKNTVYPLTCPMCGTPNVRNLSKIEQIDYIGSKGNRYKAMHKCLNVQCKCYW